ncbi:hypothetical protein [Sphingosinicella humi]|uniref:DNA binding HTH domain-containing protein n=1 Tax=Allosphingosinicella humi TaxID=2068657 RepID=A0A2U2IZG5_9SPHN|nr:hypothetical protein [Sphingosinicella humi]PWG01482.1 hypothetical protein DF286_00310 [Sphingosinicella humi]
MGMPVPSSAEGARPFTRRQALQNACFLEVLAQTGNARLAARQLGYNRSTFTKRRARDAAFAQRWEAALAAAHARFHLAGGTRPPDPILPSRSREGPGEGLSLKTEGGEPTIVRTRSGRLQLRLAPPGRMTKAAEQAFLRALAASANVRLAAAAAGFAHSSFYARARESRAFAREMRLALQMGYDRLEAALLAAGLPDSHEDDDWRESEPLPIPPMTPHQALQLLFLHEKSVRQMWEKPHRRRRRGESDETLRLRLMTMWTAERRRGAEDAAVRRAARYEESGDWRFEDEPPAPQLPPLHLVTGWSRADPNKPPHDPKRALFGGWRLEHMRRKLARK